MKVKKILFSTLILAAIAFSAVFSVSAKGENKAEIKFKETIHDFGTVKENDGPVSCDFEFTNTGNGNLIIIDAKAECGCTRPTYPKNPIAPGKTGKINVVYNPLGRPGAFDKVVTLRTNGKPSKVRLKIRGSVMPK